MSMAGYFSTPASSTLELLASVAVRADAQLAASLPLLIAPNERARYQVLLNSLQQLPIELQQFMSQKVLEQYERVPQSSGVPR